MISLSLSLILKNFATNAAMFDFIKSSCLRELAVGATVLTIANALSCRYYKGGVLGFPYGIYNKL